MAIIREEIGIPAAFTVWRSESCIFTQLFTHHYY